MIIRLNRELIPGFSFDKRLYNVGMSENIDTEVLLNAATGYDTKLDEIIADKRPDLRIYCLLRMDIEMPVGKIISQCGHGFMGALLKADKATVETYLAGSFTKIAVKAKNLAAIQRAKNECDALGIPTALITDAGRTVFNEPTVTCLGIGPVLRENLPKFVQKMNLVD
jgi:PTH2 family peptidyl-tRNA hydrolase